MFLNAELTKKRITKEIEKERKNNNPFKMRLNDDNDCTRVLATIPIPEDSLYLGLSITIQFDLPLQYPFTPPTCTCLTPILSPRIDPSTFEIHTHIQCQSLVSRNHPTAFNK